MMFRRVLCVGTILAAASFSSIASADEPYAVTPSGRTEAIFALAVVEASDRITNGCMDYGWTVVSTTSTVVICEAQLGTLQSALAQALLGNQYSTPPKSLIRFNLAGLNGGTRVQATGWVETQMVFGQTRTQEMSSDNYHNNVMNFYAGLGGQFPAGTSFPNHAYFGAHWENTDAPEKGLRIVEVEPSSAAAEAGLQKGDVIIRIARERTKSGNDLLDALHKAAQKPSYEVEFYRDGKKAKVAASRVYRQSSGDPVMAVLPAMAENPTQTEPGSFSLAEELAKFAKLRDQGIISQAEFDAQKTKLLAQ